MTISVLASTGTATVSQFARRQPAVLPAVRDTAIRGGGAQLWCRLAQAITAKQAAAPNAIAMAAMSCRASTRGVSDVRPNGGSSRAQAELNAASRRPADP